MDKAVMISIRPKWVEKIARGEKTVEVRKSRPKLEPPFKCYIYCTKAQKPVLVALQNLEDSPYVMTCGDASKKYPAEDTTWARLLNGTVCGEFTCDHTDEHFLPYPAYQREVPSALLENACLSYTDLHRYIGSGGRFYGWHIADLKIYDEPKELSDFKANDACPYLSRSGCTYPYHCFRSGQTKRCGNYLNSPPQSWCYVEEI